MWIHGKRAPPALLAVVLVIALAASGAVYAHWSTAARVDGNVNTGAVEAGWVGAICSEFHHWPWPPEGSGEVGGIDVAQTSAEIVDLETLVVSVVNGYPSYAVDCEIEFNNVGSIPVIIRGWRIVPGAGLENCEFVGPTSSGSAGMYCDELSVELADGVGTQIDPGDPFPVASSLRFHIEQDDGDNQGSSLEWQVEVCVSNWNEPQTGEDCFATTGGE